MGMDSFPDISVRDIPLLEAAKEQRWRHMIRMDRKLLLLR